VRGTQKKSPEELTAIAEHLLGSIIISVGGIDLTRRPNGAVHLCRRLLNEGHSHRPPTHIASHATHSCRVYWERKGHRARGPIHVPFVTIFQAKIGINTMPNTRLILLIL